MKDFEKMKFIISSTIHDCEQKDCIRNCQFARQKDCKFFRAAKDLQGEGYGDVRAAVREFAEKLKERNGDIYYVVTISYEDIDKLVKKVCGED